MPTLIELLNELESIGTPIYEQHNNEACEVALPLKRFLEIIDQIKTLTSGGTDRE